MISFSRYFTVCIIYQLPLVCLEKLEKKLPQIAVTTVSILAETETGHLPHYLFSIMHCSLLRLIVWSGLDVPTFATRRLHHACHQRRKVELWARNIW